MKDTHEIIKCPACGTPMEKIYIQSAQCNIDVCLNGCGGIFFDNYEFKKMDEKHEDIKELEQAMQGKEFNRVDLTKDRYCPKCGAKMMKNFIDVNHEIETDTCYECGSVFLDNNELFDIRKQYNTEEDRANAFNRAFLKQHSEELLNLEAESKERESRRSPMYKFYRNVIAKYLDL